MDNAYDSQERQRRERLEQYRLVLVEAWRRKCISNRDVEVYIGRGPSLVSKIKNGRAPLNSKIFHQLIDLFALDRARLFMAVEIAGDGMLYFDPTFRNAAYASVCVMQALLGTLTNSANPEQKALFAAFSHDRLRIAAGRAGKELTQHFSVISPLTSSPLGD